MPYWTRSRTAHPGYFAWQGSHWLYHCGDGAAYLGWVGWEQIRDDAGAMQALLIEAREAGLDDSAAQEWISRLSIDGELTGYRFECLHCGVRLAHSDAS
ncbi:CbrC family protein [Kribbella qitaiheensis]|uniref:CbrC family protein n=1 Tax=Kribbella qitaiheensis TaxID=1544730 RepID=UPI001625D774|nr:CbrC family protein [Kribbella qitaiheensis]